MRVPSQADLTRRARELVHRMHDVERWAYAVELDRTEALSSAIADAGYRLREEEKPAKASRYETDTGDALVTLRRDDLGVHLLQAFGPQTVDRLGPVLERTGFVPQSRLLADAYAVGERSASAALTTLAHMVVAWDEDWADLFLLHLASPDPVARHDAALATVVAAFSARQAEPAQTLLAEALARESFPKLRETLIEAKDAVQQLARQQVG